ncbi:flagellar hook-length control protein FliK [Desulfobaculum sp. SPO524]|uniref:flagellar hook-length control protein FliK n=1 Tax=Desulfobaculum sp. SPO524 TaxID=3378071 RepID=UPI0038545A64
MQIFPSMNDSANDVFGTDAQLKESYERRPGDFASYFDTQMSQYNALAQDRMERGLTQSVGNHLYEEGRNLDSFASDEDLRRSREAAQYAAMEARALMSAGESFADGASRASGGKDAVMLLQALAGAGTEKGMGKGKTALLGLLGKGGAQKLSDIKSLKVTREDFADLKDDLKALGLTNREIRALGDKIASDAGVTWGQLVSALASRLGALDSAVVKLTADESRQLQSLFQKMGFTPGAAEGLVGDLTQGKFSSVWKQVSDKLASVPAGTQIDVSSSELQLLGQVVKLSEKGIARLKSLIGDKQNVTLTADGLRQVMAQLKSEVAADVKGDALTAGKMQESLGAVLEKALERAEHAKLADAGADNDARNKKVLAEHERRTRAAEGDKAAKAGADGDESVAERVLKADPKNVDGKKAAAAAAGKGAEASTKADHSGKTTVSADDAARTAQDKDVKSAVLAGKNADAGKDAGVRSATEGKAGHGKTGSDSGAGRYGGEGFSGGKDSGAGASAGERNPWMDFLGKVKTDGNGAEQAFVANEAMKAAEATKNLLKAETVGSGESAFNKELSSRLMRQVENAMLRNLSGGRKQMTLKLDAADLGKLNVVLSVRDKEVSAVIRVDSHEASKVLGDQMAHLRQTLQQQGLRVQKLEVQTQLAGDQFGQNWQGAGHHNSAQQQKNSGQLRGMWKSLQDGGEGLAREMQNTMHQVNNSQGGLDIFA